MSNLFAKVIFRNKKTIKIYGDNLEFAINSSSVYGRENHNHITIVWPTVSQTIVMSQ